MTVDRELLDQRVVRRRVVQVVAQSGGPSYLCAIRASLYGTKRATDSTDLRRTAPRGWLDLIRAAANSATGTRNVHSFIGRPGQSSSGMSGSVAARSQAES